ncbi:MAG: histidine--tRNA ligase [Christensenella sp.]|uniref:histidine--tRNA ligase n=1 Tax=Christensenella sp. TaxID=1935934 RepID=UPI002B20963C|nr:histidine--tRNA ligase [Christensenella sp.]MEA5004743.1 histidine--tRNA ligase [Christensenella sp.]
MAERSVKAPKGTKDVLPQDSYKWQYVEDIARRLTALAGYREIRTPVFEHTELFLRGVGDTTDIVQKEMYTFKDKGDRSITLKPEGTAGVVRAFIEGGLPSSAQPTKMYYLSTPVFRYEKPQSGRLREHHQFGIEVFGAADASVDAEVINLALTLFQTAGLKQLRLNINSIGCDKCRPQYNDTLKAYLKEHEGELCEMCRDRMERNPLRVLDCKVESCQKIVAAAPKMIDHLCEECAVHFEDLKKYLGALGIDYAINPLIVRGLDYYTKTVFEIISDNIGSQGTVCGGGRYDKLLKQIGGPDMPGIGFGMGIERLLLVMQSEGIEIPQPSITDVFVCTHGEPARFKAIELTRELRESGIKTDMDHCARSVKAQFKYADKIGAKTVIVIGEEEMEKGTVVLKTMETGEERVVRQEEIKLFLQL